MMTSKRRAKPPNKLIKGNRKTKSGVTIAREMQQGKAEETPVSNTKERKKGDQEAKSLPEKRPRSLRNVVKNQKCSFQSTFQTPLSSPHCWTIHMPMLDSPIFGASFFFFFFLDNPSVSPLTMNRGRLVLTLTRKTRTWDP